MQTNLCLLLDQVRLFAYSYVLRNAIINQVSHNENKVYEVKKAQTKIE